MTATANWRRTALLSTVVPLGTAAFLTSFHAVATTPDASHLAWLLLATITILVGQFPVRIPGTRSVISVTDAFIFTSVLFFGVSPSVLLAGVDALLSTRRMTKKLSSTLYSFGVMSLSVFTAATLFESLLRRTGLTDKVPVEQLILPLVAMAITHFMVDSGLVAAITAVSRKQPIIDTWVHNFLWSSVSFFTGASAAALIYTFVRHQGLVTLAMVLPILVITYFTYKIYMEKVEDKNRHIQEMSTVYMSTIEALTMAIEAKDQTTYGHVRRVQVYAVGLARLVGCEEEDVEGMKAAALLHDIGKLAIPEHILNKPGKLTPAEFDRMKTHTTIGAAILSNVKFPYPVIPLVRHHHEWWDGTGYPDGLAGEAIPLTARILSIADCYDAMRSTRPYHRAMSREEAIGYIREGLGTHFDPRLGALFVANVARFADEAESIAVDAPAMLHSSCLDEHHTRSSDTIAARSVLDSISFAQRETRAMNEMARVVGRSLSLGDTLKGVLEVASSLLPLESAVVWLKDDGSDVVRARGILGRAAGRLDGAALGPGQGATGWAILHNRGIHNFDPGMDLSLCHGRGDDEYRSAMTHPLATDGRVLGALTLYALEPSAYGPDDERVLQILCEQAAVAISNTLIHEETRTTALTDPLTALPNSRYLEHAARHRLERPDSDLAILLLDLDGFKAINDRFGHKSGDRVLRQAAEVMRSALRGDDVVVRLGGDEFVVLTTAPMCDKLRQRLQNHIDSHDFALGDGTTARIGLSAGQATSHDDGDSLEALLAAADRRMYANKAERKARGRREAVEVSEACAVS